VATFESVGVILVLAMMILPPASSAFLFDRLPGMLISCLPLSLLYSLGGLHLAYWMNFPIAASIALAGIILFLRCCLFGPKGGILRRKGHRKMAQKTLSDPVVKRAQKKPPSLEAF